MVNATRSSVVIITHSLYILILMNILFYSEKIENHYSNPKKINIVIPKSLI